MCPLSMPFQAVSSKVGLLCFGFVLGWFLLLFVCFLEVFNAFFFTVNELIHRKKKKKKTIHIIHRLWLVPLVESISSGNTHC